MTELFTGALALANGNQWFILLILVLAVNTIERRNLYRMIGLNEKLATLLQTLAAGIHDIREHDHKPMLEALGKLVDRGRQ